VAPHANSCARSFASLRETLPAGSIHPAAVAEAIKSQTGEAGENSILKRIESYYNDDFIFQEMKHCC